MVIEKGARCAYGNFETDGSVVVQKKSMKGKVRGYGLGEGKMLQNP